MSTNFGGYLTGDDEPFEAERANRKFVFVGDVATIASPFAGMLAFQSAVTGGGFTQNTIYMRNTANSAWIEIAHLTTVQTWTNKSISGSSNTITAIHGSALSASAVTGVKMGNQAVAISTGGGGTTTSTSYVDIPSTSVTITAIGSRAALIIRYQSQLGSAASADTTNSVAITDTADVIKAEARTNFQATDSIHDLPCLAHEAAPSAGSLTRKARFKTDVQTHVCSNNRLLAVELF